MKIILASDHRGFQYKVQLAKQLVDNGYQVVDLGNSVYDPSDDYPDFVTLAAKEVSAEPGFKGIVLCGSGAGANIVANKIKGIRASLAWSKEQIAAARHDDDLNVLVIATDFLSLEQTLELAEAFIETKFSGEERHRRRINKITALEQG